MSQLPSLPLVQRVGEWVTGEVLTTPLWTWRYGSQLPTQFADLPSNSSTGIFINNKAMYSSQVRVGRILSCSWDESSGFHSSFSLLYQGVMKVHLDLWTHVWPPWPTFFNLVPMAFPHIDSHWHLDYGAQKPAFEKFSSQWCFSSFNINESFSVCSSDRKLGNEMTSSTSKRKFWGYNLESLNYVPLSIFLEIGPPNNSWCASQVLFTYSVTWAFHWMHRLKHEQILMCVHE